MAARQEEKPVRQNLVILALALSACSGNEPAGPAEPLVPAALPVKSIRVDGPGTLEAGAYAYVSAVVLDMSNRIVLSPQVGWTSSDPEVLTIIESGDIAYVHARKEGSVTITAKSGGIEGTGTLQVFPPALECYDPWYYGCP